MEVLGLGEPAEVPRQRGRPSRYRGGSRAKSLTLDADILDQVERLSRGNLSEAVNDLLAEALEQRKAMKAIEDLATAMGVSIDPEVEARAVRFLLETEARIKQRRSAAHSQRAVPTR